MASKAIDYSAMPAASALASLVEGRPLMRVSEAAALIAPGVSPARVAADSRVPLGAHVCELSDTYRRRLAAALDAERALDAAGGGK